MLTWALQKELVRTLWVEPRVRELLGPIIKDVSFERPDLQWITRVLCKEDGNPVPLTCNELVEKCSTAHPDVYAACKSLVPELEKAQTQEVSRAVETGRKFAAYQEALVLGELLKVLVKQGEWGEIRNRTENLMQLAGQVSQEEEGLVVKKASEYVSEKVSWLWPGYIPFGKVSTIEGFGGLGKSTITLDVIARLTQGLPPPGHQPGEWQGYAADDAVVMSAEDAAEDTIRPRLEAAGADLDRVHIVSGVNEKVKGEVQERGVSLDRDIMRLENLVVKTGSRLVVIDPVIAMMGGADFHRDQDVRRILKSLAKMAERRKCAVVTIRHFNKDTSASVLARGSGSMGFVNAVRTAMLVVQHPKTTEERVIAVYKTNLAKAPPPMVYSLVGVEGTDVAKVKWLGKSGLTVEQLMDGGSDT